MSGKKKVSAAGKKAVPAGRKAGEGQQDFLRIPDPPKPTVKKQSYIMP